MSTQPQILANQANAQKSTGPTSEAGKDSSSRNLQRSVAQWCSGAIWRRWLRYVISRFGVLGVAACETRRKTIDIFLLTQNRPYAKYLADATFSAQAKGRPMTLAGLSRRERQIMEILYRCGKASASAVREAMPDAPTYSTVRALLRVLEEKGQIEHQNEGLKYVYTPLVNRNKAKRSAVKHLVDTFFRESPEQVVAALLDVSSKRLTNKELDRMAEMIEKAKKEGR